ncbi:MAG: DUF2800 domain-containing protein, partial [Burkholderiaceae bacterium]|nr:DUF2800 domain-containing protein [Burkholderiaceae bacterium]
ELELIIVQPPFVRRWVTDFETLNLFEMDLVRAVKLAKTPEAPVANGDHCRWCPAKPICPVMNGAVERLTKIKHENLDRDEIGRLLHTAAQFEDWIKDLRALAFEMLKHDTPVPGWKMVAKKGQREWRDEGDAINWLKSQKINPLLEPEMISPAQAEKLLKKIKTDLPEELVRVVSSGSTLAPESDPRPAVLNIGRQLTAALSKLQ